MRNECPKCNFNLEDGITEICPSCGVVFAKYENYLKNKFQQSKSAQLQKEAELEKAQQQAEKKQQAAAPNANSKLTSCKSCGHDISKNAEACPNCGQRKTSFLAKGCLWIIILSVAMTVISLVTGNNKQQDQAGATTEQQSDDLLNPIIADDGKQPSRLKFIGKLIANGFYIKVEKPDILPHAYVGPTFWQADFDTKTKMLDATLTYYSILDSRSSILIIKDGMTGKNIGKFSQYGLELN